MNKFEIGEEVIVVPSSGDNVFRDTIIDKYFEKNSNDIHTGEIYKNIWLYKLSDNLGAWGVA